MEQERAEGVVGPEWSRRQFLAGLSGLTIVGLASLFEKQTIVQASRALFG